MCKSRRALVGGLLIALFLSFDAVAQSALSPIQTLSLPPDLTPPPYYPAKTLFGCHEDIDGPWMLVAPCSGRAVYAYKKTEAGQWIYHSQLAFPEEFAGFIGLVLSGRTAVLSASDIGEGGDGGGLLYVFARHGDTWRFVQRLTEPEPSALFEFFGQELAASGNTFLVTQLGAVHVYSRKPNGTLVYRTTLPPVAGGTGFNIGLAVEGNTIAVGEGGVVELYRFSHGGWALEQTLTSPPVGGGPDLQQAFGRSVALSGKTLIVSSLYADGTLPIIKSGAAFVYRRRGGEWQLEQRLDNPLGTLGTFGVQVATNGRRAAVTAPGAVFTFARSGGSWSPEGYILSDDANDLFALELERRTLAVGQPLLPVPSNPVFDGQVNIYRFSADEQP